MQERYQEALDLVCGGLGSFDTVYQCDHALVVDGSFVANVREKIPQNRGGLGQ